MPELKFPLYHGTCTLFLERIAQHGLGGWDPIKEWRVLECLRKVLPIAEKHADQSEVIKAHLSSTWLMADQVNARMNFQHGAVYLSPSKETAVRYACGKKKGSEVISRTVLLIEELVRLNIVGVKTDLFREFPELFYLQDIDASPVLIQVSLISSENLLSERGESPDENFAKILNYQERFPESWQQLSQQTNFRLIRPVPVNELAAHLIAVRRWQPFAIDYALMPIPLAAN